MSFLKDKTIVEFLNELASHQPVPGGGSASAMAGAMAASLVAMVAEFSLGNKKYKKFEKDFKEILTKAKKLQKDLSDLIDKDTQAYLAVLKNKNSQKAIKKAAEIPLQTAQKSLAVFKLAVFAKKNGNQSLSSDAVCALHLAKAAVLGALENVKINLPGLKNDHLVADFEKEINKIQEKLLKFC